jgi:hypothetical protein
MSSAAEHVRTARDKDAGRMVGNRDAYDLNELKRRE